ncbi:MAG: hypothetical protein CVV36_02100 [Candidatus Methanoperedenaceae archaeon HGW-Methanoperedenaceae-1]|nr:MAG: hypothetical protein CVV36_02100 [Candidatus Methanoperedenaceae archaeon HGW-Methanoperedenaceae-1]
MNFILHKHGYPMLNIPYEKRTGYYNALEKSQTKNDENNFLRWFFKRYITENKRYISRTDDTSQKLKQINGGKYGKQ